MRTMHTRPLRRVALAFAIAACTAAMAQTSEEYYINGVYNPTLADVHKIDIHPQPFDSILPEKKISYQLLDIKGQVPAHVDSIEAAKLNIQLAQEKLYKGFVKAGFGLYTTPLVEVNYDQTRSRANGYGINFRHMSSNGGLSGVGPSDYGVNSLDAHYQAYLKHHAVEGRLLYDRERVSYYGYPSTDSIENLMKLSPKPPEDLLKQIYNDIGFAFRLKSLYRDSTKLAHDVGLTVHNLTNLTKSRELNVTLDAKLAMEQGSETYGGAILVDNNAYRGERGDSIPELRQNGTLVGISPFVKTEGDKYLVKVGVGMYVDALGKTTFHFYPQAYLQYRLFDDILVPYAGADGRRIRNSLRSLTRENPFLNGAPTLQNASLMYDIYGGMRGSLSQDVGFDVRISKSRTDGKALFLGEESNYAGVRYGDRFLAVYDRVDQLDIGGELRYSHDEHIDVHGGLHLYSYHTDVQAEAWNLPTYTINLGGTYDFQDKLLLKVEAQFLGPRKSPLPVAQGWNDLSPAPTVVDLDGFVDLYLGLEYRYTRRLSLFLDVSNLSASKYARWYDYPVQRSLVLGGATYAF